MTENEKKQAINLAADGAIVGILCLNVDSMKMMAIRMCDAAKEYAEGNHWNRNGEWIVFPETGGMIRIFVKTHSTSHDHLFLDPGMSDAEARLLDATTSVKAKK